MKRLPILFAACILCLSLACRPASAANAPSAQETQTAEEPAASDAYRTPVLIVLGVLSVALLTFLGKPAAKKPDPAPEETPDPTVTTEEPKNDPERS